MGGIPGRYLQGVFGAPATKGEIPKRIGAKNGWDPGDTLMVFDAVSDFAGAQSSGVAFVAICDGECPAWLDNAAEQLSYLTEFE